MLCDNRTNDRRVQRNKQNDRVQRNKQMIVCKGINK
jgi:hypothetical protein